MSAGRRGKIAVIVQRCHPSIAGGSESHAWQYARLLANDYDADLITTAALDSATWQNELEVGETMEEGVRVLRFAVTSGRGDYWRKLHDLLLKRFHAARAEPSRDDAPPGAREESPVPWSLALQEEWIRAQGPHSDDLIRYLEENQSRYRAVIFLTYLYSPTYFGSLVTARERLFLVPTLHDEPPAYLSAFRRMAQRARLILRNTESERALGKQLWGELPGRVVSMGIDTKLRLPDSASVSPPVKSATSGSSELPATGVFESLLRKFAPASDVPFVYYCGRIDPGKGCARLFDYFARFKERRPSPLALLLSGAAGMEIPDRHDIKFLGFVSEEEKFQLMARALVFIMPSPLESLSVVTLEAMAQKTPALVDGNNPPLAEHIRRGGGGRAFYNYDSFELELASLLDDARLRAELGEKGRAYVLANYSPTRVRETLREEIERLPDVPRIAPGDVLG